MLTILIYTIVFILVLFIVAGAVALVSAFRQERRGPRPSVEERPPERREPPKEGALKRYVGPVEPHHALLNAPGRVAVEAVGSVFGFPGLGWLISGKVITGLVLLVLGPSLVWGATPVYMLLSGKMAESPFLIVQYLPVMALVSATALAVYQIRLAREHRGERVEPEG